MVRQRPLEAHHDIALGLEETVYVLASKVIEAAYRDAMISIPNPADPPEVFFSHIKGGCEKLPNGNVLIAEFERGRVIEVTPEGDVVWEFFNPDVNEEEQTRTSIYRMTRLGSEILNAVHAGAR